MNHEEHLIKSKKVPNEFIGVRACEKLWLQISSNSLIRQKHEKQFTIRKTWFKLKEEEIQHKIMSKCFKKNLNFIIVKT